MEADFALQLWAAGLQGYKREFRFHPDRRWRFDYAFENDKVAVEIQGGIWTGGAHVTGKGYQANREKMNTALTLGWRTLELTPDTIKDGRGIAWLKSILNRP